MKELAIFPTFDVMFYTKRAEREEEGCLGRLVAVIHTLTWIERKFPKFS